MKAKNKINAYILHGSTAALLFLCVLVALCSAISLPEPPLKAAAAQDNATFGEIGRQSQSLSFADRVAYQRAIEEVFWRHRIWPDTNAGPKPSLDAVMSRAQIEKKVEEYLRNSQALEDYWQRRITADQLQAEMERVASHTRQPEVLRELFEALGSDPFVIAECLARPLLTERLIADLSAQDETGRFESLRTAELRTVSTATTLGQVTYTLPVIASPSGGCTDDSWTPTTLTDAPDARYGHTAVWTGSEMIVWGGLAFPTYFNTGGRYNPSTDSWTATTITNAPAGRHTHAAVWTGSEMIIWGGEASGATYPNTGGRYNPSSDSWIATSTNNAPAGRYRPAAVWSGSEMISWGGFNGSFLNTGGRYNPSTDSWTPTNTSNAPIGRGGVAGVWTNNEMVVWGGYNGSYLNSGGRYNPGTNTWTATNTTGAPAIRYRHTAVWSGSEMIVWGGYDGISNLNTGGRYNPIIDSWTATSTTNAPAARVNHTAVWTGSEMIVWGGDNIGTYFNTGGRYNPSTDSWTGASTTDAPEARAGHTAVVTDSEMIVWGGNPGPLNTGARYCVTATLPITLDARVRRQGNKRVVALTWSPADGGSVDVLRNGDVIGTADDDGAVQDKLGSQTGNFVYQVCETDSGDCSNEVRVRIRDSGLASQK